MFNYLNQNQFSDKRFSGSASAEDKITKKANINRPKLIYKTENTVTLHITKFFDIENIIIPFFEKYPIFGIKSLDFSDFKKVSEIIKHKLPLTSEGFNTIKNINSKMNQRRSG